MGEIMKKINMENPFNNNIEYGLRAILLLQAMYPKKCDLDLLPFYFFRLLLIVIKRKMRGKHVSGFYS